jgi:AhpD family alkylhydroperoxidase
VDPKLMLKELAAPQSDLRAAIPEAWEGFAQLHRAALADGALPARFKELVAVAIAVSNECDGCIAAHIRGAVRGGASREEFTEMLAVVLLMNGGPATVWGPRALQMFDAYAG